MKVLCVHACSGGLQVKVVGLHEEVQVEWDVLEQIKEVECW